MGQFPASSTNSSIKYYLNKQMTNKTNFLNEVAIIRPVLVVLLVFYHAFAPYSGAWEPIEGYPAIRVYWWLDWLSYAFMLEMFVFISGYVFGFQVRTKGVEKLNAKNLLWGKFKRLMIPCMVFSLLYILLFQNIRQPIYMTTYDLINGVGHMWFLPMLYWCFVGVWAIEKMQIKAKWVIPLLWVCSVISFLPLPLRLGDAMYYMFFFYVGYILQKEDIKLDRFYTLKYCVCAVIAFCVLFPSLTLLKENISAFNVIYLIENQFVTKTLKELLSKVLQIIYSSCGLFMLFIMIGYFEQRRKREIKNWVVRMGSLCFGVYLLQQFILLGLYEYTNLPNVLGSLWLPWVGFVLTLTASLLMTAILIKTKIGKSLVG